MVLLNILMAPCCFGVVTSKQMREIEVGFVKYLYLERANTICTFLIPQKNNGSIFCFELKFLHPRIFFMIRTSVMKELMLTFAEIIDGSLVTSKLNACQQLLIDCSI